MGEPPQRPFRRPVGRGLGRALEAEGAAHIHHRAPPRLDHHRQEMLHRQERAVDVDGEDFLNVFKRMLPVVLPRGPCRPPRSPGPSDDPGRPPARPRRPRSRSPRRSRRRAPRPIRASPQGTASSAATSRPLSTTVAPASCRTRLTPAPMPLAAPVTKTAIPSRLKGFGKRMSPVQIAGKCLTVNQTERTVQQI
jgi:hypothetical protein